MLSLNKQALLVLVCFTFILENVSSNDFTRYLAAKQSTKKRDENQMKSLTIEDKHFIIPLEKVDMKQAAELKKAIIKNKKQEPTQIQNQPVARNSGVDLPQSVSSFDFTGPLDINKAAELKKASLNMGVNPDSVKNREADLSSLLKDSIKSTPVQSTLEPVDLLFADGTKLRVNLDSNKVNELKKSNKASIQTAADVSINDPDINSIDMNKADELKSMLIDARNTERRSSANNDIKQVKVGDQSKKESSLKMDINKTDQAKKSVLNQSKKEIVSKQTQKQIDVRDPKLVLAKPPSIQARTVMDTKKASELKKSLLQNQKQDASKKSSQTQKLENRQVVDKRISNEDSNKRAPADSDSTSSSTFTNSKSYELDFNSLVEALGDYLKKNNITIYNLYTNQPQEAYATSFYPKTPNGYVNLKPYEADEEKNANGYRNQPEKYKINENSHENDNIRQPNQYRVPQQNYERPPLTDIQQVKPNHKIYHAKDTNRVENENQNSRNLYQPQY